MSAICTGARTFVFALSATSALLLVGCAGTGPEDEPDPSPEVNEPDPEPAALTPQAEAKALYPRFVDVQQYIVGRSCAPNLGVCHNTFNYPDLHTAGNTLSLVQMRCNAELPTPEAGWDNCELPGDVLYAGNSFSSEIAWVEPLGAGQWRVGLREAPEETNFYRPQIYTLDEELVFEPFDDWQVSVALVEGAFEADIVVGQQDAFIVEFVTSVMSTVRAGDPNRNGVYGYSDPDVETGALIVPGNLERSYLWGRVTATVPGTQMPLANDPLTTAQYIALACWIEGLDEDNAGEAVIDYDTCAFAQSPVDYTANPGGEP